MITSYAQNFEDVMLWRALKHVENGFYVDVGAQHPVVDSVSLAFYENGWRGVHIEPAPAYANLLREHRPDEVVIQAALDAKQGLLTFFDIKQTGLSTADRGIAHRHLEAGYEVQEIVVPCLTLDEVLSPFAGKEIHWLKIDVEGYERNVLEGWVSETRPWVLVIESTLPLTKAESYLDWEPLILERGYEFAYLDGINRFYVSSEHVDLLDAFRYGPNYFDGFALGQGTPFCASLNARIQELSQHGQVLETELRAREHLAMEASRSAAKSAGELAQSRADGDALRESLAAARQHAAQVEGGLAQSREQLQSRERELTQSRSQGDDLRERLVIAQHHAVHVEAELAPFRERLPVLEGDLAASQARAERLETEWNQARAKADQASDSSHHWWTAAVALGHELQTIHASRSWRMTTPLRAANSFVNRTTILARTGLVKLISLPRRGARRMLLFAVGYVQARPDLKAGVARFVARFPRLDAHLKAFVSTRWHKVDAAVVQSAPVLSPELPEEPSIDGVPRPVLSPTVRKVYRQLVQARAIAHAEAVSDTPSDLAG